MNDKPEYVWVPFSKILMTIIDAFEGKWHWFKNTKCKYINIRIDMRNQKCLLSDQDGNPLTIEELEHQS